MSISSIFIRRPVMTVLVMIGIVVFGIKAYRGLPVSDLPNVDYPTITVNASLPGASPETMASAVATPLEKQFSTIAGIDNMTSTSALAAMTITIQFALSRNIDAAAQDVQSGITQTLRTLPIGIIPPSYQKVNPADQPILYFTLASNLMPLYQLDEYGETVMAQRMSMVSGVAQVVVFGSQKYAVRAQLDPNALAYRKIGIDEVFNAINNQNVNLPTGILWGPNHAYTVQANGQLNDAASFSRMVVAYRDGAPVRLGDLGHVFDDVQNNKIASWYNGNRSIILAVFRQPGTNTVQVATDIKRLLASTLRAQIPQSVEINTLYDRSVGIESLRERRQVHTPAHALSRRDGDLPVSEEPLGHGDPQPRPANLSDRHLHGDVPVGLQPGQPVPHGAHARRAGFVVDDAIVMLENVVRHMEMGKDPL